LSPNQQFDDVIERFQRHKQNIEDEAKLCHMIEAAEEREARLTIFATERRRILLSRLSTIDYSHKHRRLQKARHEGTGVWLLQHVEYIKWEALDTSPAALCCYGIRKICFEYAPLPQLILTDKSWVWEVCPGFHRHRLHEQKQSCNILLL
jgi:hypothetical protein